MTYGFILTRHVRDKTTNEYWNRCVKCIRTFYPDKKIVVIDDNSNKAYVVPDFEYKNITYIESEYPGAGELLPFYYLLKHAFFPQAVIIHDSVFFQKRVRFELLSNVKVMPLWHFDYNENVYDCLQLANGLTRSDIVQEKIRVNPVEYFGFRPSNKWYGCFGVQCYISLRFLRHIQGRYNINALLKVVRTRRLRCCLERIFGAIFHIECQELSSRPSLLGNIWKYEKWGYTYREYIASSMYKNKPLVKVWTGR